MHIVIAALLASASAQYDVDHPFADLESALDRLHWIAVKLNVPVISRLAATESGQGWRDVR